MSLVKSKTLLNGLKVIFVPHKVGSVTCCLRGLAGSNYETPFEIGAAHVLEHLCTYGSQNYNSSTKLRGTVLANGGRVTGTTSRDDVAYLTKTLKGNYEDGIRYLFEIFYHPLLNQQNLDETKNIIKHEIYQNVEDPKRHIGRISYQILYPNQRFSSFNTGSVGDLEKLKLQSVENFRKRLYSPSNFVLSVCGDLNANKLFAMINNYFRVIPNFPVTHVLKHKPNYKRAFLVENRDDLSHLHLKIDYHGFKTNQKGKYATYLLAKILKNRLKVALSQTGINPYILDSASFSSNSYGLFGVYTAVESQNLEAFFKVYKKVIQNLCNQKVHRQELSLIKNRTRADFEFALEKTSLKADFYSELILYKNLTNNCEDEINGYLNCTSSDISTVAKSLFKQEPKITIVAKKITSEEVKNTYKKVFD